MRGAAAAATESARVVGGVPRRRFFQVADAAVEDVDAAEKRDAPDDAVVQRTGPDLKETGRAAAEIVRARVCVPLLDLVDGACTGAHTADCQKNTVDGESVVTMCAATSLKGGADVLNDYGANGAAEMLFRYGFAPWAAGGRRPKRPPPTTTLVAPTADAYDALTPLQKWGLELKGFTRDKLCEQGWLLGDADADPRRAGVSRSSRRRRRRVDARLSFVATPPSPRRVRRREVATAQAAHVREIRVAAPRGGGSFGLRSRRGAAAFSRRRCDAPAPRRSGERVPAGPKSETCSFDRRGISTSRPRRRRDPPRRAEIRGMLVRSPWNVHVAAAAPPRPASGLGAGRSLHRYAATASDDVAAADGEGRDREAARGRADERRVLASWARRIRRDYGCGDANAAWGGLSAPCQRCGWALRTSLCTRCKRAYFCSSACLKAAWPEHRKACAAAKGA